MGGPPVYLKNKLVDLPPFASSLLNDDLATRVGKELGVSIPPFSTVEATRDGGVEAHFGASRTNSTDPPGFKIDVYVKPDGSVTRRTTTDCVDPKSLLEVSLPIGHQTMKAHLCPDRETQREGPVDPAKLQRARALILGQAAKSSPPTTLPTDPEKK